MMFFESNLKIEKLTEKSEIFTEILLKILKNFNVVAVNDFASTSMQIILSGWWFTS